MSNILHKISNSYGNTLLDTIFTVDSIIIFLSDSLVAKIHHFQR